jgi:hypothetical protein
MRLLALAAIPLGIDGLEVSGQHENEYSTDSDKEKEPEVPKPTFNTFDDDSRQDVSRYILGPFEEIVHNAQEAVRNAGVIYPMMHKAAKDLQQEGELALQLLQGIMLRHMTPTASAFILAVKEIGEGISVQYFPYDEKENTNFLYK